jgi:hypothetical protein
MSVANLFEVNDSDTVWDAWLTTISLLDMVERIHRIGQYYDFAGARNKITKIYMMAEVHVIDRDTNCTCGLSDAEHALLKRKILTFFKLQVSSLKHFLA